MLFFQVDRLTLTVSTIFVSSLQGTMQSDKVPVHYLPLHETIYQKRLKEILIQLHKNHLLSYLKDLKISPNDIDKEADGEIKKEIGNDGSSGQMSDNSIFEAFNFNCKQILHHPTLLVDHYIPKNLLLLNSKENIISLSNKYLQISNILDGLVEKKVKKTIIISVSNAKEMDLIESVLIGKNGLQYYRFSGSSLYYDNHGSFDFHWNSKNETIGENIKIEEISTVKRKTNGRTKKSPVENTAQEDTKRKKKMGRPSSAEKRAREQNAQINAAIAARESSSVSEDTEKYKGRDETEEYIPKISKNNKQFTEILEEKESKRINIYLILSSQLKYLLQFEDLQSDLVISLDCKTNESEELSSIVKNKIHVLKPIIIESLEHYEWEMVQEKEEHSSRLLTLLSIASNEEEKAKKDEVDDNKMIEWIIDPINHEYPYNEKIKSKYRPVLDESLILRVKDTLESRPDGNKRIKLSGEGIPKVFTYQKYQYYLTNLINENIRGMNIWIDNSENELKDVHLKETNREDIIDVGNYEIGEIFKKNRDIKVKIELRSKVKERNESEYQKLVEVRDVLKKGSNEDIESLKEQISSLKMEIEASEKESGVIRAEYQEKSTLAVEKTRELKSIEILNKQLIEDSKGIFHQMRLKSIRDEQAFINRRLRELANDKKSWEGIIQVLKANSK